jgi:hypothetical protein
MSYSLEDFTRSRHLHNLSPPWLFGQTAPGIHSRIS